ncbi:lipoprotein localization factor LolB [Pusillimonas sp. TS35]|uniref:outer membrane lipoprotein LolB n=1 Tax=Paracandidimonas lactea TaxID=2895524 RepID=UPI001367ABD9|nr:outer membrane lipoprotein LolB [Paracandidimonas lactea]MYN13453.1 lipoprotein localization factor LolB [Pusillimonas sp. TS35]
MTHISLAKLRAWSAAGLAALALAGCATPPPISESGAATQQAVFERTGRFAINVSYANGQRDALQGGFAWLDNGRRLVLDLANPVGSTLARVEVTAGLARVTRSDGSVEEAANADALVEQVLGSPLPVSGLRDWLRGRTGDGVVNSLKRDAGGQPGSFTEDGWRVRLSRYDGKGPGLVQLDRDDANRRISARLVIDS